MTSTTADELAAFHAGRRDVIESCYRDHFRSVSGAVGRILSGADRDTVVHEVFMRVISDESFRRAFNGGSLGAWLSTVARNQAIDFARRHSREVTLEDAALEGADPDAERRASARILVDRFRQECLPPKWEPVFRTRFLEQKTQREAAVELGIQRTTLAYQELRIRSLLRRFFLEGEVS